MVLVAHSVKLRLFNIQNSVLTIQGIICCSNPNPNSIGPRILYPSIDQFYVVKCNIQYNCGCSLQQVVYNLDTGLVSCSDCQ